MDRFLVILTLLSSCAITTFAAFTQSFHSSLTQTASVGCSLADNLTLAFFLDIGSDPLGVIYLVNQTDANDNTEATFSTTEGSITGTGTAVDPYTFSVVANLSTSDLVENVAPESLVTKAEIIGNEVLTVQVMVKSSHSLGPGIPFMKNVIFPDDVLYVASCNVSELSDIVVSTGQINATGKIDEVPLQLSETVDMVVSSARSPVPQPTSNVNVGDRIILMLRHTNNETSYATGLYAHSCSICDTPNCAGTVSMEFIDPNGCSVTNYITQFISTPSNAILASGEFRAFKLQEQDYMFYRCYVNFCYTPEDPQCVDYCAYKTSQSAPARKRRGVTVDEAYDDIAVSTFLRVTVGENNDIVIEEVDPVNRPDLSKKQPAAAEKQQDLKNTALLGTVVALAVLLLVGLAVAILIFYRLSAKTKSKY